MAYKREHGWQGIVRVRNLPTITQTFRTKAEAESWEAEQKKLLRKQLANGAGNTAHPATIFGDALKRYQNEVSPKKRGARWEIVRIDAFLRDDIAKVLIADIGPRHFSAWRDKRLLKVKSSSVNRELTILHNVCEVAKREWQWLTINPVSDIKRPKDPPPRERRISDDDIARICISCGYDKDEVPEPFLARVGAAFLLAIETAMRAGEIIGLTADKIDLEKRIAYLEMTKNGSAREVPLSKEAIRIIKQLLLVKEKKTDTIFGIKSETLDALFRKIRNRADVGDLHFHDTRREALSRLAKKFDVMELARISGHRDLKILLNVYYRPKTSDLVEKIDQ